MHYRRSSAFEKLQYSAKLFIKNFLFYVCKTPLEYSPTTDFGICYNEKRFGIQQPHRDENISPRPSIGLQLTMKKPSHHRADCSWPQNIIIHRYSEEIAAPLHPSTIKNKLKVKTKQDIQRPEFPSDECKIMRLVYITLA